MKASLVSSRKWLTVGLVLLLAGGWRNNLLADKNLPARDKTEGTLPMGTISLKAWMAGKTAPLEAGEIDRLVVEQLARSGIKPAPVIGDEQFLRRVWLDLTGRLPMPADVKEFLADRSQNKRARVIDRLLETEDYARHWAGYWQTVISSRLEDIRGRLLARHFQHWLTEQLQKNKNWGDITRAILTASGKVSFAELNKNGQSFFLASRLGADAVTEQAAETSRIFLGIQIQCAQCHNHPSDVWKRHQFHELAAYFARVRARPFRAGGKLGGLQLVSTPFGEHRMPSREDPKKSTAMQPRFLDGKAPPGLRNDLERRKSLAEAITSKDNPWFAAAYVNRIWGELMGQSFYRPVDDLGPRKEAVMPEVLVRLAAAFRGSNYDIKGLFRSIMNSRAYQRQIRPGESAEDHLLFAAAYPRRLDADSLWQALEDTLGKMGGPPAGMYRPGAGPFARLQGFDFQFKQEFQFDPSTRPEEVEGSISQALLMMNSPILHRKIQAQGSNLLARIFKSYPENDEALRILYLRTLARRPTDRELQHCRDHLAAVSNRTEAFEDILWALLNSTEFQTKR